MKKLVLGSLNIDCTYQVEDFVRPKETISALHFERFCGGKGFNQAVALARAGSETWFAGVLGADGGMLLEAMQPHRAAAPVGDPQRPCRDRGEPAGGKLYHHRGRLQRGGHLRIH